MAGALRPGHFFGLELTGWINGPLNRKSTPLGETADNRCNLMTSLQTVTAFPHVILYQHGAIVLKRSGVTGLKSDIDAALGKVVKADTHGTLEGVQN